MGLIDIYKRWKERQEEHRRVIDETPDDVTTDKYLRSLRRWKRRQNEELEKERLTKELRAYEDQRTQKYLWGVKPQAKSGKKKIQKNMLSASYNIHGLNPILGKRR